MNYLEQSKILAPVDFSEFSQVAVETALKIASKHEHIMVLHVVDPTAVYDYASASIAWSTIIIDQWERPNQIGIERKLQR